jgi:hypothetical protein
MSPRVAGEVAAKAQPLSRAINGVAAVTPVWMFGMAQGGPVHYDDGGGVDDGTDDDPVLRDIVQRRMIQLNPEQAGAPGYGSKYQVAHRNTALNLLNTGGVDPIANPKRASFTENLMGSEDWLTADKHFMRLVGILSEDPRFLKTTAEVTREVIGLYDQQNAQGRALMDRNIQQFFGGVLKSYQQAIKARPNMSVNQALMNVISDLATKGVSGVKAALAAAPAGSPGAAFYPGLIGAALLPLLGRQLAPPERRAP